MLISLNWLKNYLDFQKITPEKLSGYFNELGFPVENISVVQRNLNNILIGKIINIEKHPNANRLKIATVSDGKKQYRIVCGAPNIKIGDIVPLALPKAIIQGKELQPANIRGIISEGMLCSAQELGIGSDQRGIWQLPKNWQTGKPLKFYVPEIDYIYELEIPPNRPDCLGYLGIARELSAKLKLPLKLPGFSLAVIRQKFPVKVTSSSDCPYYLAIVLKDIAIGESPAWMQLHLIANGLRPINNIVDITNYVLLEYGHPLHAFDLDKLNGGKIIVRRANPQEKLVLLDGQEVTLDSADLVIADEEKAVALAGIMGGEFSGVTETTNTVVLESAVFNPALIRKTRKKFNLNTEASYRFERTANSFSAGYAAWRAVNLIQEIAGAKIKAIGKFEKKKTTARWIKISSEFINEFGSINVKKSEITEILKRLHYSVRSNKNYFYLQPPRWRLDIQQPADVVEEICRHYGYQHIQEKPLPTTGFPEKNLFWELSRYLRQKLLNLGLNEITTNPLISETEWKTSSSETNEAKIVRLQNPTAVTNSCLRPNLLSGLLRVSEENAYETISRRYFEIGTVFIDEKTEKTDLGIILAGKATELNWLTAEDFTFYHLKGILEHTLSFVPEIKFIPAENKIKISTAEREIGFARQIKNNYYGEIYLEKILDYFSGQRKVYQQFSEFPRVLLDLALICPEDKNYQEIYQLLTNFLKDKFLEEIVLFDVYTGKNIPAGKKSFTFRLAFRSPTQTLQSEIVNQIIQELLKYLQPYQIELRQKTLP